jgi:hypothetical protein
VRYIIVPTVSEEEPSLRVPSPSPPLLSAPQMKNIFSKIPGTKIKHLERKGNNI